jgi:N-acetylglucosamine-6-sulfatase
MHRFCIRTVFISGLVAAWVAVGSSAASPVDGGSDRGPNLASLGATPPNVILVKTDDQVFDKASRLAAFMPRTAAFFSSNGVSYVNSQVSSPSCCQSRASTFVGRYPHNEGVISQGLGGTLDTRGSIAAYLQRRGYRTALFGKYLNLVPVPPNFDDYITIMGSCDNGQTTEYCTSETAPAWYYNFLATFPDGSVKKIVGNPITGLNYQTTWLGGQIRTYLTTALAQANTGKPFYLEIDPTAPHLHDEYNTKRNMTEPRYRSLAVPGCTPPVVETDRSDKPAYVQAFPLTDPYSYGVVCPVAQRALKSMDDVFGAIIDQVRASGQLSKTLVIFTSDNGLMYGEHGLSKKYVPYSPSVRVPLMLAYPGVFAPGTASAAAAPKAKVSNIDILPTILSVTGTAVDPSLPRIDGRSLVTQPNGHTLLLGEYWRDPRYSPSKPAPIPTWASITDGRYTFIITYDGAGKAVTQELYDSKTDPGQMTNLIPLAAGTPSSTYDVPKWTTRLNAERACAGTGAGVAKPCH